MGHGIFEERKETRNNGIVYKLGAATQFGIVEQLFQKRENKYVVALISKLEDVPPSNGNRKVVTKY